MISKEQTTQTEKMHHRRRRRLLVSGGKHIVQIISSLMLPLMLGIFTVVITFHQQKIAREQRLEDLQLARQQQIQDRNESLLQREHELNISRMERESQNKLAINQYQDEIVLAYIKEIIDLLKENNGTLTSNPVIAKIARIRTLHVILILDGPHVKNIVYFLYTSGQLNKTNGNIPLDISTAVLRDIDFVMPGLKVEIEGVLLVNITFLNVTFSFSFDDGDFSYSVFSYVNFFRTHFSSVNFSPYRSTITNFLSDENDYTINRYTLLDDINFSFASFVNVDFSSTTMYNVNFSFVSSVGIFNFSYANLNNVDFSSASSESVDFQNAKITYGSFVKCKFQKANFRFADLSMSVFWYADLRKAIFHGAILTNVNFSLANLQKADFTNTTITDSQLQSALSIQNARLPNGTLGQNPNLIKNGDANCNILLAEHWQVQYGHIAVLTFTNDLRNCQFVLQYNTIEAIMSQRIKLKHVWDSTFWTISQAIVEARMSNGVLIELIGRSSNETIIDRSSHLNYLKLHKDMEELEVLVKFNANLNNFYNEQIWCDDIKLIIDYGRGCE